MEDNSKIGIAFIYGAGLSKWIWNDISKLIDVPCLYVDYPGRDKNSKSNKGLTIDDYSNFISDQINNWDIEKVVIIAHSIGGVLALNTLNKIKPQLIGILAISASIPVNGGNFLSSYPLFNRTLMKCVFKLLGTKPPKAAIIQSLCNDIPIERANEVVNRFTQESLSIYIQTIKYNLPDVPKLYIKLTNDAAFGIQIQDKMIENLMPQIIIELNTGHLPMISKPNDLAKIINEFVSKINV
jgi:pimeloyl-ACP methyl ester carboxylesterase